MSAVALATSILSESVISFAQAARRLPPGRNGKPTAPSTLWRWTVQGVIARDGTRVFFEAVKIGGRAVTSEQALARFAAKLSGKPESSQDAFPEIRSPNKANRESAKAGDELKRRGY